MEGSYTGKYRQGVATEGKLCLSNYAYVFNIIMFYKLGAGKCGMQL